MCFSKFVQGYKQLYNFAKHAISIVREDPIIIKVPKGPSLPHNPQDLDVATVRIVKPVEFSVLPQTKSQSDRTYSQCYQATISAAYFVQFVPVLATQVLYKNMCCCVVLFFCNQSVGVGSRRLFTPSFARSTTWRSLFWFQGIVVLKEMQHQPSVRCFSQLEA